MGINQEYTVVETTARLTAVDYAHHQFSITTVVLKPSVLTPEVRSDVETITITGLRSPLNAHYPLGSRHRITIEPAAEPQGGAERE